MCSIWIGKAKEITLTALADEQVRIEHKIKKLNDEMVSYPGYENPDDAAAIRMLNGEIGSWQQILTKLKKKTDEMMAKFREIEALDDELDEAARVGDNDDERMIYGEINGRMKELGFTRR